MKSANGLRYSHKWIMNCLLLHIKSSAAYNMLRANKILPLPSRSTICRYLKSSNAKCGFDPAFFSTLKERLAKLPCMARHGILCFDEMKVLPSKDVNMATMKFDGFVDYGEEFTQWNNGQLADHALVIMFSSLTEKYHQPVAMFGVSSATPGMCAK